MLAKIKKAFSNSYDVSKEHYWSETKSADPETPRPPRRPETRFGSRPDEHAHVDEDEEDGDATSSDSKKKLRGPKGNKEYMSKRGRKCSTEGAGDGVSFVRGSVGNNAGGQGDFTPYGYVSRPGSTPLSYSLWGSSASTTSSEESYRRHFSRSLCRVVFGCAIILVILAVLGIVGIAIYLGVLTNEDEGAEFEVRYNGHIRIDRGDTWIPALQLVDSAAFKAKANKYEKMLEKVYENSFMRGSLRRAKVLRFTKNNAKNKGLNVQFTLGLDRRKMPSHVDNTVMAVRDVLLQELMSMEPVAFKTVAVDIDSLVIARDTEVGGVEVPKAAVGPVPVAAAPAVPLPASPKKEEDVQVIKVEGTQQGPGGAIMIRKPSGSAVRTHAQQDQREKVVTEAAATTSTVGNLVYEFGPWRPVNPFNVFSPSATYAPSTTPATRTSDRRDTTRPYFSPSSRPPHHPALVTGPRDNASPIATPTTTVTTTTTTTTTPTTTTTTTSSTTTSTTTTTAAPPATISTNTPTTTPLPPTTTAPFSAFRDRLGIVEDIRDNKMTTKRNPSKEDLQAILAELLFFTTPRPQLPPQQNSNFEGLDPMIAIPQSAMVTERTKGHTPNSENRLVTFQSISEQNRPPSHSASHSISNTATTMSMQVPESPKVTSYSGVREPIPPMPPPVRFPLDRFRYPITSSSSSPTYSTSGFNIWDLLTTRKPLILNTEVVTSTSMDVQFGSTERHPVHNPAQAQKTTTRFLGPIYRPPSSLAPVYRPDITSDLPESYTSLYNSNNYASTDQYGPVYRPTNEPSPLKDFASDQHVVAVPIISGGNVQYLTVNRTRSNYPNVVIVNLQTTPENEVKSTTPVTPALGDSRRLDTKHLEDAFRILLENLDYRGLHEAAHFEHPLFNHGFSSREGKPVDYDTQDTAIPLHERLSDNQTHLFSLLRNLSQIYLSDPAVLQQLRDFEKSYYSSVTFQPEVNSYHLNESDETVGITTIPDVTSYFTHLQGSTKPTRSPTENDTANLTSDYTLIPLTDSVTIQTQNNRGGNPLEPKYRSNWEPIAFEERVPKSAQLPPLLSDDVPTTPSLTLIMTDNQNASLPSPHIIGITSRSPGSSTSITNPPIHTFVLKEGQSLEELLQEIFDTISLEEENETSPATKEEETTGTETTTLESHTTDHTTQLSDNRKVILESINRIFSEHINKTRNHLDVSNVTTTAEIPTLTTGATTSTTGAATSTTTASPASTTGATTSITTALPASTSGAITTTLTTGIASTTGATTTLITEATTTSTTEATATSTTEATTASTTGTTSTIRTITTLPTRAPFRYTTKHSTSRPFSHDLFPVMTRPMHPIRFTTTTEGYEVFDDGDNEIKTTLLGTSPPSTTEMRTETSVDISYSVHSGTTELSFRNVTDSPCSSKSQFRCDNGECIPEFSRCNLIQDCKDSSDEANCTCADLLKRQLLSRKICDGIVDCWDHSDETNCDWCKPGQFICSASSKCIELSQVCDGVTDCEGGDDEKNCVTIAPDVAAADSLLYKEEGYLMVRKKGRWGKLCIDNFENAMSKAATTWSINDLGQAVCKTLTFSNFQYIERQVDSLPLSRSARPHVPVEETDGVRGSEDPIYYEINVSPTSSLASRARFLSPHSVPAPPPAITSLTRDKKSLSGTDLRLSLEFERTSCPRKDVVKVSCSNLQCGMRPRAVSHRARIVGGSNSGPGSWPWHAALYKEGEYQCGATLINNQWLVSAGHCFVGVTNAYWVARLGALRRGTKFPSPFEQLRHITHIFIHPEYVEISFINDISLLRLNEPVRFTDYVRPVCLPSPGSIIRNNRMCTLVGWGQLYESGKIFPDTLQEVQVPLISTVECVKRTAFLPLYRITDDMFCAGFDRGGRDACLGDSGGPLMCQEPDGTWMLVGVTSNGYGCARPHRPGVYTKVVKYLEWMNQVMELTRSDLVVPMPTRCNGHRCPLGQCLSKSSICNSLVECSDGSDEANCQ
ncbi:uncharacterized protein [Palaemon carinicauda]|uniref:uncharacterized protein isoform X2 n=1 Tax=Palaemon carinicauda TaxID=392227 RepID=UPI0035B60D7F